MLDAGTACRGKSSCRLFRKSSNEKDSAEQTSFCWFTNKLKTLTLVSLAKTYKNFHTKTLQSQNRSLRFKKRSNCSQVRFCKMKTRFSKIAYTKFEEKRIWLGGNIQPQSESELLFRTRLVAHSCFVGGEKRSTECCSGN